LKNIFVGNLSFGATEDAVRSLFEQYGAVDRVSIVTDRIQAGPRDSVRRNVGRREAERAINSLNGQELDGRNLTINEARPKEDRGGGGFGGGRGGNGAPRQNKRW